VSIWLKVYEILATGNGCGLLECVDDALSIDGLKKKLPQGMHTLSDYFKYNYGSGKCNISILTCRS
jgi:hypothetical protein